MSRRQQGAWPAPDLAVASPSPREFARLSELLHEHAGLAFDPGKSPLIESRVRRRLRALGLADYGAYLRVLDSADGPRELVQLIDVVATGVTRFFREPDHFAFAAAAARGLAAGGRRLHFWSAGCATGEEPYSLAMVLRADLPASADWRILATDISTLALQRAQRGNYTPAQVAAVPRRLQATSFAAGAGPDGGILRVVDELKQRVLFRRLNLGRTPYPIRGDFDVVFCRNVLIYFDPRQRAAAVAEFHRLLRPGGHLIVGPSETLLGVEDRFDRLQPAVYRRV